MSEKVSLKRSDIVASLTRLRDTYPSDCYTWRVFDEAILLLPDHAEPPPNAVRVRIAVAVAKDGLVVGAWGVDDADDDHSAMQGAKSQAQVQDGVRAMAFIEADIPLIPTVSGRVVESEVKS